MRPEPVISPFAYGWRAPFRSAVTAMPPAMISSALTPRIASIGPNVIPAIMTCPAQQGAGQETGRAHRDDVGDLLQGVENGHYPADELLRDDGQEQRRGGCVDRSEHEADQRALSRLAPGWQPGGHGRGQEQPDLAGTFGAARGVLGAMRVAHHDLLHMQPKKIPLAGR